MATRVSVYDRLGGQTIQKQVSVYDRLGGQPIQKQVSVYDRLGGQPIQKQVCVYWLKGKCNRNPCKFMHKQPSDDSHHKQSTKMTWKNSNYLSVKNEKTSSNEGQKTNGRSDKISQYNEKKNGYVNHKRFITDNGLQKQKQQEVSNTKGVVSEINRSVKDRPKQCKFWVTNSCAQGENCKDVHSWFSGSGLTMLTKLEGHNKDITGISFPSGSDKLYSSGQDGFIRTWNCNTGQCDVCLNLDGEIGCLINEGPWLLAGLTNVVKAWNLQTQIEITLNGSFGQVHCMVMDEDMLFAGTEDGSILVWKWSDDKNTFEPTEILKGHKGAVISLVIGAKSLYSGSKDCSIRVWDCKTLQFVQSLQGHTKDVTSVICWDNFLLSASMDKTIKAWATTESGIISMIFELKEEHGFVALCGIHDAEDKPILLCSCDDNTVRLYDLPSFHERGRIFLKREVRSIQIGVGGLFFTGDATGDLSVWKLI